MVNPLRGKLRDYLAMSFDYSTKGVVTVDMVVDVKGMLPHYPVWINKTSTPPADTNLLEASRENALIIDKRGISYRSGQGDAP